MLLANQPLLLLPALVEAVVSVQEHHVEGVHIEAMPCGGMSRSIKVSRNHEAT
jgi:hypothetical protein